MLLSEFPAEEFDTSELARVLHILYDDLEKFGPLEAGQTLVLVCYHILTRAGFDKETVLTILRAVRFTLDEIGPMCAAEQSSHFSLTVMDSRYVMVSTKVKLFDVKELTWVHQPEQKPALSFGIALPAVLQRVISGRPILPSVRSEAVVLATGEATQEGAQ